jgi:hypothetical protein
LDNQDGVAGVLETLISPVRMRSAYNKELVRIQDLVRQEQRRP